MKKLIVCIAVLLALCTAICCVSVACTPEEETDYTGLNNAREYLQTMLKNEATVTGKDFTRPAVLRNEYGTYTVTWTITVTSGSASDVTLSEPVNGLVTINVDEFASAEVVYTLTAVISDAEGNTVEALTYNHKVPAFVLNTYEDFMAACVSDAEEKPLITIKGYVVGVNADSGSSSKGSLWIIDEEGYGYYAYKPALEADVTASREALNAAFPRGTEVVVKGTVVKYGGCYEFEKDCEIIYTGSSVDPATLPYVDKTELFSSAASMTDEETLVATQSTRVALNNVTMGFIDGYNYHFTLNGIDYICYMNIYLLSSEENATLAALWKEGGKANLTGIINVYSSKYQIYPDSVNSITIVEENLTDAQKVEREKEILSLEAEYDANFTLPEASWADEIIWSVTGAGAVIGENNAVTISQTTLDQTVTFTATINCGEATDTATFSVIIPARIIDDPNTVFLNTKTLGVGNSYADGTATVEGIGFSFVELGNYGDGIQWRIKNEKTSALANTSALARPIASITLVLSSTKSVYDNADVFSFKFGNASDALGAEVKLSTVADQLEYTITPDAKTYTYFSMTKIIASYTFYVDSITINYAGEVETDDIDLTIDALGVASQSYAAGNVTIEGVDFSFVEIGNYGSGIQMRNKLADGGNVSTISNTSAFASGLKKIIITLNAGKTVYDNTNVFLFKFGNASDNLTSELYVSTVANQYEYVVTPDAETYTYFSVCKDLASYTFYVDSFVLVFGDEVDSEAAAPEIPEEEEGEEGGIVMNIAGLGVASQSYADGTATIGGVEFSFIEIGNYGSGIQMRNKLADGGKVSTIANTSAFSSKIASIIITLNAGKTVYDNTNVFLFKFGTDANALTTELYVSTVANQYEYTITPDGDFTYFSVCKDLAQYTFYVDSITFVLAE